MTKIKKLLITSLLLSFGIVCSQEQGEISLDENWEIVFDHQNEGAKAAWHKNEVFQSLKNIKKIKIPSSWETIEQDYEGVAFYRYAFDVPENWKDKVVRLQFDAVNYLSEVWLNGEVVGFHEGGFTPFEFRVDNMIETGKENVLILRVVGPILLSDKKIDGVTALQTPQWRGGISGGIWQKVRLIASGETYVKDVFIEPNIQNNSAAFHLELDHTAIFGNNIDVAVKITDAKSGSAITSTNETLKVRPGLNDHQIALTIPNAKYWSPDNPHLYKV